MRLLEICFWDALYWLLYLPTNILLLAWTGQGDLLGILIIGFVLTLVLTVFLATQDDLLFDDWEPAIVYHVKKLPQEVPYAEEEKPKPQPAEPARQFVGFEPGTKMRTDVDLGMLDADDDDILG